MPISQDMYPSEEEEEEVIRNPHSLKSWLRYLTHAPPEKRVIIYERALKALPGSYKLWHAYLRLRLRLDAAHSLPITHAHYKHMDHAPSLAHSTRPAFDRALHALPVTQPGLIWEPYLAFASQKLVPLKTSVRVYSRFLKYDPTYVETVIEFLIGSEMWKEAAERLVELEMAGLDVDAIVREGIRKFTDETGNLWISLSNYYIKRGLLEKARDVYEEGMMKVATVRDFSVVFDAYSEFEESLLCIGMENIDDFDGDGEGFWLKDGNDVDMELSRVMVMSRMLGVVFDKAVQADHKAVDDLASVWCEWVEMELRHDNLKGAVELLQRATYEPSVEVKRSQESDGSRKRTCANEALQIPQALDILCGCDGKLFEEAPAESVKPLYLQYAKMEEEYGLAKRAMEVYDKATKALPTNEKLGMYEIYIAKAAHMFGLPKTREIYEQAINGSGLADEDVMAMCLRYAEIEVSLGEIERARALYKHASQYAQPRFDHEG
ncbi:hypothetical protein SASPL_122111 [Salvia splendens]|uniref:Pre-mRNA-splicing factor SYF1 n=1 Tax=Salvia splendens TaxID=180675 RepID=A0A8X8ZQX8_SALSN|nr:hypothetical protein SASPL_122111 [Salvia splendens]